MSRNMIFAEDEYYHFYNRGVDKRIIFQDERDYERFLSLLFLSNSDKKFEFNKLGEREKWSFTKAIEIYDGEKIVQIGAYCLMTNHFHILIKVKSQEGASQFMHKLATGYTMYFNKKYHRTGSLFEGTFKSQHVNEDRYLKYLFSYIHLNPIGIIDCGWKKKEITDRKLALEFLNTYKYSSLKDYLNEQREESVILYRESFPQYDFSFENMIIEWLDYSLCEA
ncbi:MAG: transposase [Candidatus Paceibacterota bacterium]